ncbi:MAG: hypothetical protein VYC91_03705 [Acidobacteriota bacterium]|nr:hypothetical protein [Acidobacteriota bacterium]
MGEALFGILIVLVMAKGISLINYAIDERYLRIRIGPWAFRKFAISDFKGAEVGVSIGGESWTNTINMLTIRHKGVTLYRRSGFFQRLIITPADPAGFVERVKFHPHYQPDR